MGMDVAELAADKQALGPLEVVGPIGEPWKPSAKAKYARQTWRYRYAPQDYDIGSDLYDPALYRQQPDAKWSAWKVRAEVQAVDDRQSTVDLAWPAGMDPPHPEALVPLNIYGDKEQRAALLRLGEWVAEHGIDAPGPWRAARDVLLRRPPSVGQVASDPLQQPGETGLDAACRIVEAMDHGALAIQGPPGSGKTYTGARMVVRLVASGRKVGISANSHKVIGNFLTEHRGCRCRSRRADPMHPEGHRGRPGRRRRPRDDHEGQCRDAGRHRERRVRRCCRHGLAVGADKSDGLLDVLFIDEAGQMSLANLLAMSGAARSIVLLGDPQQLDQPLQGSHPPGADRSALAHLIGEHDAMPDDLGLFLEHTWRLHPDVTKFTSTAFYEGKLQSRENLGRQFLHGPAPIGGSRRPAVVRRARRQRVRVPRGGSAGRGRRARPRRERIKLDRQARRGASTSVRGRPRRGAVQRPGRRHPARAA